MPAARHVVRRRSVLVAAPPVAWQGPVPGTELPLLRTLERYRFGFLLVLIGWCVLLAPLNLLGIPLGSTVADILIVIGAVTLSRVDRRAQALVVLAGAGFVISAAFDGFSLWNRLVDPSLREPAIEQAFGMVAGTLGLGVSLAFLWILLSFTQRFLLDRNRAMEAANVEDRRYWVIAVFAGIGVVGLVQTFLPVQVPSNLSIVLILVGLVAMIAALAAWIMVLLCLINARQAAAADILRLSGKQAIQSQTVTRATDIV